MRLVYLCAADPPPPKSDFPFVLAFFDSLPEYLRPRSSKFDSPHMLYFADRIGSNWLPEFHDFAVVFLSDRVLNDENALSCLNRAKMAFPSMVGIDLYNNLSPDLKEKAGQYCKRVFACDEGKEFLLTTFPEIAMAFDLEEKRFAKTIEDEGYKFLEETVDDLKSQERAYHHTSMGCYALAFLILCAMLLFTVWQSNNLTQEHISSVERVVIWGIQIVALSVITVSMCRFLFLLGKSFMVESIRRADRAHAIKLGLLYMKLYKEKIKWEELRDVLQNWNIDKGSAFINLDAKDIEAVSLDKMGFMSK